MNMQIVIIVFSFGMLVGVMLGRLTADITTIKSSFPKILPYKKFCKINKHLQ